MKKIILRAETKKNEFRRALTPNDCEKIIANGHAVIVEDWSESIIPIANYKAAGCEVIPAHSWKNTSADHIIIGLKALPEDILEFKHTHIFFAHAYKDQDGWRELLAKFQIGGGRIIDLEFMLNENNRRVCAFGYWAGYVGAALGALFAGATDKESTVNKLKGLKQFSDKKDLLSFIRSETNSYSGDAIVIGCKGRSGQGALDLLEDTGWRSIGWDKIDTERGGPFPEILNYELFVNCVLAMEKMPPFITKELVAKEKSLKMISDVSCDPDSDCNMIPLYNMATTISNPLFDAGYGVEIVAIDNLPSILPKESSFDFSSQLSPFICDYSEQTGPIKVALDLFNQKMLLI